MNDATTEGGAGRKSTPVQVLISLNKGIAYIPMPAHVTMPEGADVEAAAKWAREEAPPLPEGSEYAVIRVYREIPVRIGRTVEG